MHVIHQDALSCIGSQSCHQGVIVTLVVHQMPNIQDPLHSVCFASAWRPLHQNKWHVVFLSLWPTHSKERRGYLCIRPHTTSVCASQENWIFVSVVWIKMSGLDNRCSNSPAVLLASADSKDYVHCEIPFNTVNSQI